MGATLRWNPFALVTHNQVRLPRIVHHLAHVALGAVVGALAFLAHVPPGWALVIAAVIAWYDKRVWLDWSRKSGEFFHPWVPYQLNPWDFGSDLGLSLIGAALAFYPAHWALAIALYYPLSLVNDP